MLLPEKLGVKRISMFSLHLIYDNMGGIGQLNRRST